SISTCSGPTPPTSQAPILMLAARSPRVSVFRSNFTSDTNSTHFVLGVIHEKTAKRLPFVCRLEDATSRKLKPALAQLGNVEKPVNAKGGMNRQQSATPGYNMEALC